MFQCLGTNVISAPSHLGAQGKGRAEHASAAVDRGKHNISFFFRHSRYNKVTLGEQLTMLQDSVEYYSEGLLVPVAAHAKGGLRSDE